MRDLSKNYLTIQGWMVSDLKLSSNNLLVYALIFGFCQDENTEFKGSISYICDWLNCTRPTASKALDFLVTNNLIFKRTEVINKVSFNMYKINLELVKNLYRGSKEILPGGSKESLPGGSKESLHNNNIFNNNNINNNKKTYSKLESYFFCSDDWFLIWEKWLEYKSEIKSNYKTNLSESTAYKKLLELSNNNLEIADKIIMQSIENDWKGLFELKNNEKKGSTLNF